MNSLQYKLIVSDFDGTLLRSDGEIAPETLAAIEKYQSFGGCFSLCTGRTLASALPIARRLGLTGLVACFQGSVIADIATGVLIEDGYIESSGAAEICRFLEGLGQHIHVYDTQAFYANKDNAALKEYERIVGVKGTVVSEEPLSAFVDRIGLKTRKVLVMVAPEKRSVVFERLLERFGDEYYITCSAAFLVEVSNRRYSKATALEKIAAYYGVSLAETVAVGDGLNDLPMIQRAGLGIAVKNAEDSLKEKADTVFAYSNDENAIGEIISQYGFGEYKG